MKKSSTQLINRFKALTLKSLPSKSTTQAPRSKTLASKSKASVFKFKTITFRFKTLASKFKTCLIYIYIYI